MADAKSNDGGRYEVPGEIIEQILSEIPLADTQTLSTLLRVSKALCRSVAPRLYSKIVITPDADLLLDTALPGGLLDGDQEGQRTVSAALLPKATLKHRFLSLTRTLDVYPRRSPPSSEDEEGDTSSADVFSLREDPQTSPSPPNIELRYLRLRLDTSSYQRPSPYHTASEYDAPPPHITNLLGTLRPHRLVVHGAGFHQGQSPTIHLPPSHFETIQEIFIVVTPGAMPEGADMLSINHGLPYILDCLSRALATACYDIDILHAPSVDITFILQTPRPGVRFPPIDPTPHGAMMMTMDYHPDYAPGYLHALTTSLSQRMVVMRTLGSEERRARVGTVSYVGFGSLEGYQVGMPQAAEEEMQDRFERGLRVRLRRAGVSEEHQGVKVMGMREWLNEVEGGGEGVLDEDILRGWRRS